MTRESSINRNLHPVVSHEEWLKARTDFLAEEKDFTRLRDDLSRGYPLRISACDSRRCSRTPERGDSDCCYWLLRRVGDLWGGHLSTVYELVEGGDDMAVPRVSCSTSDRPGPAARSYLSVQPVEMKRIEEVQKRQNW